MGWSRGRGSPGPCRDSGRSAFPRGWGAAPVSHSGCWVVKQGPWLLAAGGLASCPSMGMPPTPPSSLWAGNSCRGDQPGLVSGHWLTAGPGSVESVGGCSGLLFSQVCALGFRSEVVNATVAVDQGCPMKGRWQGTPKRRPGRFRQDVRRGVRTCCQRASFVLSFLLPAPGRGVWGQWADLSLGRGVVLEGIVRKMDLVNVRGHV